MHCGCKQVNFKWQENSAGASQERHPLPWCRKQFSAGEIGLMLLVHAHLGSVDFLWEGYMKLSDFVHLLTGNDRKRLWKWLSVFLKKATEPAVSVTDRGNVPSSDVCHDVGVWPTKLKLVLYLSPQKRAWLTLNTRLQHIYYLLYSFDMTGFQQLAALILKGESVGKANIILFIQGWLKFT